MKVFLSYSRRDADFVDQLSRRLTALGYEVWVDREDIIGGGEDRWRRSIVRAIRESDAMVLVLSPNATTSENVERELSVAADNDSRVVPVLHQPCELPDGFQYELAGLQYIDFSTLEFDEALRLLVAQLGPAGTRDGLQPDNAQAVVIPARPPEVGGRRTGTVVLIGAGVVACVVVAVVLASALRDGDDEGADDAAPPLATAEVTRGDSTTESFTGSTTTQSTDSTVSDSTEMPVANGTLRVTRNNGSCSASTCEEAPIAFVIEGAGESDPPTVELTDPSGFPVESAEPPSEVDSTTHEWLWRAGYGDPIGDYQVVFAADDVQIVQTFRVDAVDEAFGVVQNLAAAVAEQDWDRAATIDLRFEDDLRSGGAASPDQQYADWIDQHWIASDPAGDLTDHGTQIVGAFVAVNVGTGNTGLFCERWIVFPGDTKMRSSAFPTPDTMRQTEMAGTPDASEVETWVETNCSE